MNSLITEPLSQPAQRMPRVGVQRVVAGSTAARQDLEALGLRITERPEAGAAPYLVLQARCADARCWLVPARPRAVRVASLALIQPVHPAARWLKQAAIRTRGVGMEHLWSRGKVHVSGVERAAAALSIPATHAAFFTGTPGPHRKAVAQLMDAEGNVRAYAKASCRAAPSALLQHEAATIDYLQTLGIHSGWLPHVRFHGLLGTATVLVTDTVKTPRSRYPTRLQTVHVAFLDELATRTASRWATGGHALLDTWRAQVRLLSDGLSPAWRDRFQRGFARLEEAYQLIASPGLAHGDFTPTNTFLQDGRLCVFDWEYAGGAYPADFDLVRFLGCQPALQRLAAAQRGTALAHILEAEFNRAHAEAAQRVIAFLCVYALRRAAREPRVPGALIAWPGATDDAATLDALLAHPPRW